MSDAGPPPDPRIDEDPDYVAMRHHGNSLRRTVEKYPDGLPHHVLAKAIGRSERAAWGIFGRAIQILRRRMRVK